MKKKIASKLEEAKARIRGDRRAAEDARQRQIKADVERKNRGDHTPSEETYRARRS